MAATKYQKLQKASSAYCKGKTNKSTVAKAASDYIKDAVAKGQTKAAATAKANRVQKCKSKVAGTKKKTTAKRATTKRKPGRPKTK